LHGNWVGYGNNFPQFVFYHGCMDCLVSHSVLQFGSGVQRVSYRFVVYECILK
jgi:hypothetical protein